MGENLTFKIISVDNLVKEHWPFLLASRSITLSVHKQNWKVTGSDRQAKQALLANTPIHLEGKEYCTAVIPSFCILIHLHLHSPTYCQIIFQHSSYKIKSQMCLCKLIFKWNRMKRLRSCVRKAVFRSCWVSISASSLRISY